MKLSNRILFLLAGIILIACITLALEFSNLVPEKLVAPIISILAIVVALISQAASSVQWEKGRLGDEILKEQFRLITSLLDHIQKNPNAGFPATSKDGKTLKGGLVHFSAINYSSLNDIAIKDRFIVKHFPPDLSTTQLFNELNNEIIHNPLFPSELYNILNELSTSNFFTTHDYAKYWFQDEFIPAEMQFISLTGARNECLDKKPLRIPYCEDHLRVLHVLAIYKKFNKALNKWAKQNHVDMPYTTTYRL